MEKLKGGNVLLDLTNITLSIGTNTTISDAKILKAFLELYPLVKSGSPKNLIFLKVADASEEIIVPCEHVISGTTLEIRGFVQADEKTQYGLVIEITYSVGSYDAISITSAKYTYSDKIVIDGDATFNSNVTIDDDLSVAGKSIFGDDVKLSQIVDSAGNDAIHVGTSDVSISKDVNVGDTQNTKDLFVSGNETINGNLEVGGDVKLTSIDTGTIDKVLGLDSNGNVVKNDSGTKIYKHNVSVTSSGDVSISEIVVYNALYQQINNSSLLASGLFINGFVKGSNNGILIKGEYALFTGDKITFIDVTDFEIKTATVTFGTDTVTKL